MVVTKSLVYQILAHLLDPQVLRSKEKPPPPAEKAHLVRILSILRRGTRKPVGNNF